MFFKFLFLHSVLFFVLACPCLVLVWGGVVASRAPCRRPPPPCVSSRLPLVGRRARLQRRHGAFHPAAHKSTRLPTNQPDCTQINPTTHKSTRLHTNQPDCTQINPTTHISTRRHTYQPDCTQINPTQSTLHINPARCVMASWSSKATLPPHKAPRFPCPPLALRPNGAKRLPPLRARWALPGGVAYVPEFINPANQPYCTQINPTTHKSTLHYQPCMSTLRRWWGCPFRRPPRCALLKSAGGGGSVCPLAAGLGVVLLRLASSSPPSSPAVRFA